MLIIDHTSTETNHNQMRHLGKKWSKSGNLIFFIFMIVLCCHIIEFSYFEKFFDVRPFNTPQRPHEVFASKYPVLGAF